MIVEKNRNDIVNIFNSVFSVKHIDVSGNHFVQKDEIILKSGLKKSDSIFSNSVENIRSLILEIDELKNVMVMRKFPDTYKIYVSERKPIAYLKRGNKLLFVDEDSNAFPIKRIPYDKNLAILTGKNAEAEVSDLFSILNKFPVLKEHIAFCNRVSERRWNIQTKANILIKLPEKNILSALSYLEKNSRGEFCFQKGISIIDLRINDRVIIHKLENRNRRNNEI